MSQDSEHIEIIFASNLNENTLVRLSTSRRRNKKQQQLGYEEVLGRKLDYRM